MNRPILVILVASMLVGCGETPTARLVSSQKPLASVSAPAKAAPTVSLIAGNTSNAAPVVTVLANAGAVGSSVASTQQSAQNLMQTDKEMESVELLIEDGAAYYRLDGWFSDLENYIERTWTEWKLSRAVKAALNAKNSKEFDLLEGQIDTIKKNRTAPVTKINSLGGGNQEIIQTWTSTDGGTFAIETHRIVDTDGVSQTLSVTKVGKDTKGNSINLSRIRSLIGADGTYQVATKQTTVDTSNKTVYQEWNKKVYVSGAETIIGFINLADGYSENISGSRDINGKVQINVTKLAPTVATTPATPAATPTATPAP